ncbi:hypothetical protein [Musicola paradisiaca]|uniref:hypothetical protein n=1 Tax=Musicola paradisiaca TaxID=69223 RepID=UPI0003C7FDDF|nr:hypothetical protein [Musicola paradisiaca]
MVITITKKKIAHITILSVRMKLFMILWNRFPIPIYAAESSPARSIGQAGASRV